MLTDPTQSNYVILLAAVASYVLASLTGKSVEQWLHHNTQMNQRRRRRVQRWVRILGTICLFLFFLWWLGGSVEMAVNVRYP